MNITKIIYSIILAVTLSGCLFTSSDQNAAEDINATMVFQTTIQNDGSPEDYVQVSFEADGVAQSISDVKLNSDSIDWDSATKSYLLNSISFTENESYEIICYINQSSYILREVVAGNEIDIIQSPSFKIKVASSLSGLLSETAINYVDSISKSQVIGIALSDTSGYEINGTVQLENTSTGVKSQLIEIKDGWFISSQLINGNAIGFIPNQLTLNIVFSYNGKMNTSFNSGSITRSISISKVIEITN